MTFQLKTRDEILKSIVVAITNLKGYPDWFSEVKPLKFRWIDKRLGRLEANVDDSRYSIDLKAMVIKCKGTGPSCYHTFEKTLVLRDSGLIECTHTAFFHSSSAIQVANIANSLYKEWINYLILKDDK